MFNRLKSILISLYIWGFLFITILPLFLIYLMVWLLVLSFDSRKSIPHDYTVFWARLYLWINPWWSLDMDGMEKIDRSKPVILVANHQSVMDIAMLLQLGIQFRWVCKIELVRIPVVGWVIRMNRHILVRRGNKLSVLHMADACKNSLANGIPVCFFPEGTRTEHGDLGLFKDGAFILARETGHEIVPVILDGPLEALPKRGWLFKGKQHFMIRVLDRIPEGVIRELNLDQLVAYTRNIMADCLKQLHHENQLKGHGKNSW
jgi:1-acyl-sn-glycerol-3-phosphate acyltransferase